MNKPVHHNKRHLMRNWIVTVRYEGRQPFQFGTLRSIADNERDLRQDAGKFLAPYLTNGYVVVKLERGRIEAIKETD